MLLAVAHLIHNNTNLVHALVLSMAMGVSCALLSVVVVLRRWAFIGEGISHAGFGGIGTCWLLSLAFPFLANQTAAYGIAVLFCIAMALSIGFVTRGTRMASDTAIGIFLVASLAWGFMALAIFRHVRGTPVNWEGYLFGDISQVSARSMIAGLSIAMAVILVLAGLCKEILAYSFDPLLARVSGVRAGAIHYMLMVLLAMIIVTGMGIAGNVLVTALLVLPGATALLLSRNLKRVLVLSVMISLAGTIGGVTVSSLWTFLPSGACMVLVLFVEFATVFMSGKAKC